MMRSNDTLYRQWLMLAKIPRFPRRITVSELKDMLSGEGYDIHVRTVQRDLEKLSAIFPLSCATEGRTNYWYWQEAARIQDLPNMDMVTALAFVMADSYLQAILPPATLSLLQPYFQRAHQILTDCNQSELHDWPGKVAVIGRGPELLKPQINPGIQQTVYEALLKEQRILAIYQPRNKDPIEYTINPLGIVNRQGVIYLVCTLWQYQDIKQLALHRFQTAERLDEAAIRPESFNLQDYISKQHQFAYPLGDSPITLQALFEPSAVLHLYETPLAENQTLTEQDDGRVLLQASVWDSRELRWWLAGLGSQVEVVGPGELREYFIRENKLLIKRYHISDIGTVFKTGLSF